MTVLDAIKAIFRALVLILGTALIQRLMGWPHRLVLTEIIVVVAAWAILDAIREERKAR